MKKLLTYLLTVLLLLGCARAEGAVQTRAALGRIQASPLFVSDKGDAHISDLLAARLFDRTESGATAANGAPAVDHGVADFEIVQESDGGVAYNIQLREGLCFSDGQEIDADDVIFSMYVLLDPTYDGGLSLSSAPISGLDDYRGAMLSLYELLLSAGRDNTNFSLWTQEAQAAFWADVDAAGAQLAQDVTNYLVANNLTDDAAAFIGRSADEIRSDPALQLRFAMEMDGFGDAWFDGATPVDFWLAMVSGYDGDPVVAADSEGLGRGLLERMGATIEGYSRGVSVGDGTDFVSGIERTGKYSLTVHMDNFDAAALNILNIPVVPLHIFGNAELYDYDAHAFGFTKGDLSNVRAVSATVGCGRYVVAADQGGEYLLDANPSSPDVAEPAQLRIIPADEGELIPGLLDGRFDYSRIPWSAENESALEDAGNALDAVPVTGSAYGYIGINANRVKVGEADSDASKALRNALLGLFEAQRDSAVQDVYGAWATAISDPIWPGSPLSPAHSTAETLSPEAALENAVALLQRAGYAWNGERFTSAPEDGSMEFVMSFPTGAEQSVGCIMAEAVRAQLDGVGLTLKLEFIDPLIWQGNQETGTAQIWVAECSGEYEPDLSALYHSADPAEMNVFGLSDAQMDEYLAALEVQADPAARAELCAKLLDVVREWGVAAGVYSLNDMIVTRK